MDYMNNVEQAIVCTNVDTVCARIYASPGHNVLKSQLLKTDSFASKFHFEFI